MKQQSRLTGAASVTAAQGVVLILGYVTHLWIGRVLGPGPYGIYGVILSLQTIIGLILTLGVPAAVSRFVAQDHQHSRSLLKQATKLQLLIAFAVAIIVALFSPLLARALGDASLTAYILFVSVVVLTQALYPIYVQYLSGLHKFNKQAALTTVYAIAKLCGALSLIYIFNVFGAFAGFAVGGVIAAAIGWSWTRHLGGDQPIRLPTKQFLKFASTYTLILVALQLLISLDLFMIKALLKSDTQAGLYNSAVTLSRIPYMLLQALTFIILPSVSNLTRPGADQIEAKKFITDVIRYLIMLIIPGAALAATTSKPLLRLFFSDSYTAAAPALTILMIGLSSLAFFLLLANIAAGAGRARAALYITLILLVISAISGNLLIPNLGLIGAALQTTLAGLIGLILITIYTVKSFRLKLPLLSTLNILIATAISISITYFWQASPITLIPQYILIGIIYVLCLWILREIKPHDRARIASLHPKLSWLD
jgi:O-antigen/teichoic acid export membrane protein